jgi:hypothetical protein
MNKQKRNLCNLSRFGVFALMSQEKNNPAKMMKDGKFH